ncbi:MAG: glycosyl hydrolase 2 galactose-binding domain-containing protein [Bacteroidota bacterium]
MKKALFLLVIIFLSMVSCQNEEIKQVSVNDLTGNWEFSRSGENNRYHAKVPGTVHTDLMAHELIPDPFIGYNEDSVQWIEDEDWIYTTKFILDSSEIGFTHKELIFEGLDTYADVYLNGELIITADNMFIPWQKEVSEILKEGENEIKIHFHSAVKKGMEKLAKLDYLLIATNEQAPDNEKTNVFTRKAPFHFGWDWGPRLVTCGIWRPVYLKSWNDAIIEDVYLIQKEFGKDKSVYIAEVELAVEEGGKYNISLSEPETGQVISKSKSLNEGSHKIKLEMEFENPKLWWSNGLGEPHLYTLGIDLKKNGNIIHSKSERLGIRKIELVQEPDEVGRSFLFELNDVPVFMKGANYIPGDIFIPRVSDEKYQRVIQEAVDANMNMLRVWGGAIYENDIFYDLCDENGILVWQDFMFACAMQPGDSAHLENVRKEAEYNVKRLRNHPSMSLWCGNNENLTAWHTWGWQDRYTDEQNEYHWQTYKNIFYKILPDAVKKYDPEKSYWPSSPQSYGDRLADRKSGDEHDWSIWFGQKDYSAYGEEVPRFVSEYGLQSFPPLSTLDSFAQKDQLYIFSDLLDHRQRSKMNWVEPGFNGNDMILRYLRKYFPEPKDFEDMVYLSQLSHLLSMKEAVEAHRGNMPHCMGSLYWQINDCWPTISWSSVDYYGNWKASHYQAKRSFEKIIITEEKENNRIRLKVVSDFLADKDMDLQLNWINNDGNFQGESISKDIIVKANTSSTVYEKILGENEAAGLSSHFLLARIFEGNELITEKMISFVRPNEEILKTPRIEYNISRRSDSYIIDLESDVPARFIELIFKGINGHFDDNYFHLSPDNPKRIMFYTGETIKDPEKKLRIRTLNERK